MTIPNVSTGQIIDATTFGNAVVDAVNAHADQFALYLPLAGGTLDSGAQITARGTNASAPAYSFAANRGCGLYLANGSGAGIIGLSGELWVSERLRAQSDLQVDGQIKAQNGSEAKPAISFTNQTDMGMWRRNATDLAFSVSGHRVLGAAMTSGYEGVYAFENLYAQKDLQVDGTITTGAGKAVYFGGNWDDAFIANTTASGREYMNFGESAAGGARLRLYGPGDPSSPGDVLIYAGGSIAARFNKDRTTKLYSDLQVDGLTRAQNGTKTAPAYSFTSDPKTGFYLYSKGIASIVCDGKNVANFGTDGVAFPEGLAETTGRAANMYINPEGQIFKIKDVAKAPTTADVSRLENIIKKLSDRIGELETRLISGGPNN